MRRFLASAAGIVAVGLAVVAWTWLTLGWEAAWRFLAILGALGLIDAGLAIWSTSFSQEVNLAWRRNPARYWFWAAGMIVGAWMLHVHFVGLG